MLRRSLDQQVLNPQDKKRDARRELLELRSPVRSPQDQNRDGRYGDTEPAARESKLLELRSPTDKNSRMEQWRLPYYELMELGSPLNGRVYSPGYLGWVQCYWCRRWRFIRCLVSNQCRRWTFTGTEWRFIYCWEIHSRLWEHCLTLPSALHAMESMEEPESVWTERGDGVIHECVIQPLTRTIIDGRVYSPGLLGWLQCYWCWRWRFTRCSVSDPLCDRCLDLNEPPWDPNNKQPAVLYFQRTLRQQADNYSRVFGCTETTSRQLQSCILYLQAEEEEAHVSSEQDVDSPRPMPAAVRPTASNCWRECLKLWRPPEAC